MRYVLMEATIKKSSTYKKKYKCPYCDLRFERQKLHLHIQDKHEELIPEGYTALRVAFNTINNKAEGHCIMCGDITDWNETKGRYERLCNKQSCHDKYKQMAAERNKNKYGTERLQSDPRYAEEVQRKALSGRRLAGKYKFRNGTEIEYLGTYEMKFLEFMDKVMLAEPEDITAPGPSIEYQWNGSTHLYISDFYYIPYNLIIEIKDGGDNPNKNPAVAASKLDRQVAKEEGVRKTGKFNYIRLTNNNFGQLLEIMAVLKYNMQNECYDPVLRINEAFISEDMSGTIGAALAPSPIPYESDKNNYYMIQHPENNVFAYGITKDPVQYTVYGVDPQEKGFYKAYKTNKKEFSNNYLTFKIKDKQKAKELYDELAQLSDRGLTFTEAGLRSDKNPNFIYSYLTGGNNILESDQLLFDDRFELVRDFSSQLKEDCENLYKYLIGDNMAILKEEFNDLEHTIDMINGQDLYKVMPDGIDNLDSLDKWKDSFDATSHQRRKVANDISISKYGTDNLSRYNSRRAELLGNIDPNITINEMESNPDIEFHNNWENKLKAAIDAEANGLIIMVDTSIELRGDNTEESIMLLKDKWNKFLSLSQSQRALSNNTALNIFGIDNYGLYEKILNAQMSNKDYGIKNPIINPADPTVDTVISVAPYYSSTSDEINYTPSDIVKENGGEYHWCKQLSDFSSLLHNSYSDKDIIKNNIRHLGWNPEIPFTESAAKRTWVRKETSDIFKMAELLLK